MIIEAEAYTALLVFGCVLYPWENPLGTGVLYQLDIQEKSGTIDFFRADIDFAYKYPLCYPGSERKISMQYYYHEQLANLDDNGFGVIYVERPSAYMPAHWHDAVELLLFSRGNVTCRFSHSTLHAEPGDVYVINSHDIHETYCTHNAKYLCVHILPSRMCRFVPNFDQLVFSFKFDPDDPVKSEVYGKIREHLERILTLRDQKEIASALEIQSRLFAVAFLLVKYFSSPISAEHSAVKRSDMNRLEPILEYTRVHHSEELTLDGAANAIGLNREYFCRLFKKNMGVSYLTYLNQIRATAVCRELETSEDPIGQIGERHGFANSKMMNQYFRELYGCTPSEKRKAFRQMVSDGVY